MHSLANTARLLSQFDDPILKTAEAQPTSLDRTPFMFESRGGARRKKYTKRRRGGASRRHNKTLSRRKSLRSRK